MSFTTPQLSGAILLDQIQVLTERFGQDAIDRALATLEPQEQQEVTGLLAVSWCSADLAMRFKNAVAREVQLDSLEVQRFVCRIGIERTVRGIWRFLLGKLWDDALIKRVPMIYSRAFDCGNLRAVDFAAGGSSFVLSGWPTIPDYDAHGLAYGMETVLSLAGRKVTRVSWRRDRDEVVFSATWQK